jgi:hypothetical protein
MAAALKSPAINATNAALACVGEQILNSPNFRPITQQGRAEIAELLGEREIFFPDRDDAVRFCQDQPPQWRVLLQQLQRSVNPQAFTNLENELGAGMFESAGRDDGQTIVKGRIPLLSPRKTTRLVEIAQISSETMATVCAAVLVECREVGDNVKLGSVSLGLLGSMLVYASGGMLVEDVERRLTAFENRVAKTQANAEEFAKSEKAGLESFKASLSEEVRNKSATELWQDRARWHRGTAAFAMLLFFAIVAVLLVFGALHLDDIVTKLPRDKDMHIEYVSIALLAIPALAAGWCLKLLARLVQTNSVLGDDARQRQAMARTYLALVADPLSQVTKEDRLVMLNAIFRPLPGLQSDEVAPPTVLDILKKGEH